jgi:hypothetical protein
MLVQQPCRAGLYGSEWSQQHFSPAAPAIAEAKRAACLHLHAWGHGGVPLPVGFDRLTGLVTQHKSCMLCIHHIGVPALDLHSSACSVLMMAAVADEQGIILLVGLKPYDLLANHQRAEQRSWRPVIW